MEPGLKLCRTKPENISAEDKAQLKDVPYHCLVKSLIYLVITTRPDIAFAVQQLSQFLDSYTFTHWNVAIQVVRYLKGTRDMKLYLGGSDPIQLTGYSDSDWANCLDTRCSIGGYGFTLGKRSGLILWSAKKQQTMAASSCEAEYVAAAKTTKEAIWIRTLLSEIGIHPEQHLPTTIRCNNTSAISLSEDPSLHFRVKHIDIKFYFTQERVESGEITLLYINTKSNIADGFTKALDTGDFRRIRGLMGIRE